MYQYPASNYHDLNLDWLLEQMKNCLAEWKETKEDWQELSADNAEFKEYVTNYFNNLDLTEEISAKIDALVQNGTILEILTEDTGDGSPLSDSVGAWLNAHITQETGYVIDDTLTVSGAAADAKAAGDAIADLKGAVSLVVDFDTVEHESTDRESGYYYIGTNGVTFSSGDTYYSVKTDISDLPAGSIVKCYASLASNTGLIISSITNEALEYVTSNNAVEKGYEETTSLQLITLIVPENAKWITASIRSVVYTGMSDFDLQTVSAIPPTIDQTLNGETENAISNKAVFDGLIQREIGINLIDKTKAVSGAVQSDGSIATNGSWANYKTSDYISVESGKSYKLYLADNNGQSTNTTRLIYCLFNAGKVATSYTNESGIGYLTISPSADGFVRVCCENTTSSYFANNLMLIEGTTAVPYETYTEELVLNDSINPNNSNVTDNILRGKKWAACGDSFTAYTNSTFADGKYSGKAKTYPYLIALRNDMTILSQFFASGRTLAYPSDGTFSNSLTCPTNPGYYQNIPSDVDYITVMLGINDCQHTGSGSTGDGEDATGEITLGTIDDATTATYYGAWNVVLGWIRNNRPFAHVGIIVTNGTERQDYTEAQIAIARKWGYPLLNLNGDDHTPAMLRCYNTDISASLKTLLKQKQAVDYDGTITGSVNLHPNYQAHAYESTFIEDWLRSL